MGRLIGSESEPSIEADIQARMASAYLNQRLTPVQLQRQLAEQRAFVAQQQAREEQAAETLIDAHMEQKLQDLSRSLGLEVDILKQALCPKDEFNLESESRLLLLKASLKRLAITFSNEIVGEITTDWVTDEGELVVPEELQYHYYVVLKIRNTG
ncbi:MAG TPA: hypothetical protein VD999_06700 [Vitreimonas sp.]|nr:hypothetical protein [Vitreimonas sp.]